MEQSITRMNSFMKGLFEYLLQVVLVVAIVQHRGSNIYLMLIYTLYNTSKLHESIPYT